MSSIANTILEKVLAVKTHANFLTHGFGLITAFHPAPKPAAAAEGPARGRGLVGGWQRLRVRSSNKDSIDIQTNRKHGEGIHTTHIYI